MPPDCIVGWDIGGAHVKVSILRQQTLIDVIQLPCPLWRGISWLEDVADEILSQISTYRVCHAVTMTGEMVDLFSGRNDGVHQILAILHARIKAEQLYVFAGGEGLLAFTELNATHYALIASANWLASAVCAAKAIDAAVLVDIGSTTTDVLLLGGGEAKPSGFSDYERLISGELVYAGIVRTPIAALAERVFFEGNSVPLMAECFATTADVYRLTGELKEDCDQWPPADNGEKSLPASARRLARMIGRDLQSTSLDSWIKLATFLREQQLRTMQNACIQQLSRLDSDCNPIIIGAGMGRFLAVDLCARMGLEYREFSGIVNQFGVQPRSSDCAPSVSVAMLLAEQLVG